MKSKSYGPGAKAMSYDKDRDETGDVGTGRKKITPKKAGKPRVEPDKTENPGKPPKKGGGSSDN